MREKDCGAASLGIKALGDVLEEGVVGPPLRRDTPNVATIGIFGEGLAVPGLDGIRRFRTWFRCVAKSGVRKPW